MQHLENDMDELFQRAADNYPLQAGEGDWESVAKRIADKQDPVEAPVPLYITNKKKFILLFLLLFIGAISWFVFENSKVKVPAGSGKKVLSQTHQKVQETSSIKNNGADVHDRSASLVVTEKDNSNHHNIDEVPGNNFLKRKILPASSSFKSTNANSNSEKENPGNISQENSDNYSSPLEEDNKKKNAIAENLNAGVEKSSVINKNDNEDKSNIEELKKDEKAGEAKDFNEKKKKAPSHYIQKKKGLYLGIIAGPDFSKVQSGSFDHSGFNAGLIAGYRLNQKISFETGINWNKKYYTSEGKSFNMDKVGSTMPSGMVINNLESSNSFIEIPIKIKFDFFRKGNSDLFFSAGVSSYIITKEQNMYSVTFNGANNKILGVYKKNNYGVPAVAGISVGYEKRISKSLDLRIEPYFKIPLMGMGVGSLPVTSIGLQVGIIGRLK